MRLFLLDQFLVKADDAGERPAVPARLRWAEKARRMAMWEKRVLALRPGDLAGGRSET
jgi:hypothetical protein